MSAGCGDTEKIGMLRLFRLCLISLTTNPQAKHRSVLRRLVYIGTLLFYNTNTVFDELINCRVLLFLDVTVVSVDSDLWP